MSRVRYIEISPEVVLEMMKIPENGRVEDGKITTCSQDRIPDSAKALRFCLNEFGRLRIVIEDESFEDVRDSQPIPRMEPWYTTRFVDEELEMIKAGRR